VSAPLGSPWPDGAQVVAGELHVGGCAAHELADAFGTPLYVYDAATLRARAGDYARAIAARPGGGFAAFACKACSTVGVLRVLAGCGLGADVSSAGELAAALRAGVDPVRTVLHGNAKADADIEAAVAAGCRLIVVDSLDEPARIAAAAARLGVVQEVAVRVTPGIEAGGHPAIATGGAGSKFGLGPSDAAECVRRCLREPRLRWQGLHVHLGSQIADATPLRQVVGWLAEFCRREALAPRLIDLGGGLGIAYEDEPPPDTARLAAELAAAAAAAFPGAELVLEPGRSICGPAGVTLYRVVARKLAQDGTRWLALDGGMSVNPRPALYGARYTAAAAGRMDEAPSEAVSLAGPHCESGDVVVRRAELPVLEPGELVARAATGAYVQSMASNYNSAPRAAAVLVDAGRAELVTRRETLDELLARDL
jgi:diaminopimelate decarboxylase